MKKKSINQSLLEVHKPSSQITCLYELKGKSWGITPTQHDSMNYICYTAREQIFKNNTTLLEKFSHDETFDEAWSQLRGTPIKIDLRDLTKFVDKFETNTKMVHQLIKELEDVKVTVGHFKKDDTMVESRFSLIGRTDRVTNSNIISVYLEPELILGWMFNAKPFAKMYLKIQTTLKRTYTKVLYEICKDYLNLGSITKEFTLWKQVLHLDAPNISQLKGNFLNKSIKDINELTDIKILNITGKKENGISYMTVEFEKQSQERLQELNLIESSIVTLPFYNKSKDKLDNLINGGYKVIDEEMWIEADIKKNEARYTAETKLDEWEKRQSKESKIDFFQDLATLIDGCDDHAVYLKDYRLVGVFSQDIFTKDVMETMEKINWAIDLIENTEE